MSGTRRWHFECPECEFDDKEAGQLADDDTIYCSMCAEDTGHIVLLRRWLADQPEPSQR